MAACSVNATGDGVESDGYFIGVRRNSEQPNIDSDWGKPSDDIDVEKPV